MQWVSRVPPAVLVGGLLALIGIPLLVALIVLHDPRWYPLGDLAMIELRVRDVGLSHPPLLGLPGRITGHDQPGSHLGPLSFYAMAPTYRLMGSTAWGLKVAVMVLDLLAIGLSLWMVRRRTGGVLGPVLGFAVVLALLLRAYGPHLLTEPWNPFMPILWWVVFLVAVWSVVDDDLPLLPLAVVAGTFCVQTHVSYLGLVPILTLLAFGAVGRRLWLLHKNPVDRRRYLLWGGGALALGVLLWLPPLIEELTNDPGNMSIVIDNFRDPSGEELRFGDAVDLWLWRLDPRGFVTGNLAAGRTASRLWAGALLVGWAATAMILWRRRSDETTTSSSTLLRLHLVVAVAVVTGLVSLTRVFGIPWYYLHLWGWGTATLLLFATGWSVVVLLRDRLPDRTARYAPYGLASLAAILVVTTLAFGVDASRTEVPSVRMTATLRSIAPETIQALKADDAVGGGPDGRYVIRWNDALAMGDQGWGLLDELERAGLDVYVEPAPEDATAADPRLLTVRAARDHRVLPADEATGIVTLAVGPAIDDLRERPGTVELAYHEPRSPEERLRYAQLRAEIEDELETNGLAAEIDLDGSLFAIAQHPGLSDRARDALAEMQTLGLPAAVFVEPAE